MKDIKMESMVKMKEFIIAKNDAGQRLDKFLAKAVPLLPKSLLYKYIRIKRIKVNQKRCEISTKLSIGDAITLYINDEFFSQDENKLFLAAPTHLTIVYEDENILLIDKPAGLIVHSDEQEQVDVLIHRVQHYLYNKSEYDPSTEHSFAPALCNRIDRNTGGIVVVAKNMPTLQILNEKIKEREIDKFYLCIVHGHLQKKSATLSAYHTKDSQNNIVKISNKKTPNAKTILTKYKVLKENKRFSLVEVELLTGRTHQIRAHFAHIGNPLLGDSKYGFRQDDKSAKFGHQLLYSYRLKFCFKSDAGILNYLNNQDFQVAKVSFYDDFLAGNIL